MQRSLLHLVLHVGMASVPMVASTDGVPANRKIEVVNKCERNMVFQATGGNTEWPCPCAEGLTCDPDLGQCFFDLPKPDGGWTIAAGASLTITTPNAAIKQKNTAVADWSGKFQFVADDSDGGPIRPAICPGLLQCPTYTGLVGPATTVEFTLAPHGPDYYDVSLINGANIPIEFGPDSKVDYASEKDVNSTKGYWCNTAAAKKQKDERLSSAPWTYNTSTGEVDIGPLMNQVDGGHGACTSNGDCASPFVCGQVGVRVKNPKGEGFFPTTNLSMECGNWIGLWTATEICVWSGNTYKSPAPFEGLLDCEKDAHWFGCDGPEPMATSCYQDIPFGSECCGCPNWEAVLGVKPIPTNDKDCQGHSESWLEKVLPWDMVIKRACPTCYSYQYDDETSTFTCRSAASFADNKVNNNASYLITLCPDGSGPAPAPPTPSPSPHPPSPPTPAPTPKPPSPPSCKAGDSVLCPGTDIDCAGNSCCPDGSTCPSADSAFHGCSKAKTTDCTHSFDDRSVIHI